MTGNITTELKNPKERTNVNAKLISGLPLTLEDGIEWGI